MALLSSISARSWLKLTQWTVFGTLGCVAICVGVTYVLFSDKPSDVFVKAIASATVLPTLLAGPLFFFLSLKLRELAIANHRLSKLASIDSLTGCLNRGAFARIVDEFLGIKRPNQTHGGALLVIDADHFKSINDRFGHHRGDEALVLVSNTIRSTLSKGDRLGRLGGEEFGVFLQDVDLAEGSTVAECIRQSISSLDFRVDGLRCKLSVSIGGAVFARHMEFADLFRIADKQLYAAKNGGRDRIEMICVPEREYADHLDHRPPAQSRRPPAGTGTSTYASLVSG
ncbi:MAG: GGDEF domain-containing protein [Aliihoeflea sp.]